MNLLTQSASALARGIRSGEMSSVDVVSAHIDRVRAVNGELNALVRERFAAALEEARAADDRVRRAREGLLPGGLEALPPFLGVPCTIKESAKLAGMPHTSGLVARASVIADRDGTAPARMREAGFIPLGVTNVSELCMWMESNNKVYGLTRNPYDPTRTAGGSSGGEGALVGAGASPLGLGSDIGGSIRMPAFFNGVFGHKSTGGLVPGTGQFPPPEGDARRYMCTGPLARRAEDLMPVLRALAGPDGEDGGCIEPRLGDPRDVRIDQLTVVHVPENGFIAVSEELRAAQRRCVYALANAGARIEEARPEKLRHSLEIWSAMLEASAETSFATWLGNGRPLDPMRTVAGLLLGRSPYTLPGLGLALIERAPRLLRGRARRMIALGAALREELCALIGERGVMLYPPYPSTAPRHHHALLPPVRWCYTAVLNVLEMPVTQVPVGLGVGGLPLGVQVAAVHGNDHVTIRVAIELERALGGWVPPPSLSRHVVDTRLRGATERASQGTGNIPALSSTP
jgi:fatty acid amide hydrolase 2